MSSSKAQQDEWSGKIGVILAVAGSAVGLGNFLRFPGLAAQYGGGAFMVAYGLMLVLVGVPVAWAEWSIGRRGGQMGAHCAPGVFWYLTKGSRLWKFLGVLAGLGRHFDGAFIRGFLLHGGGSVVLRLFLEDAHLSGGFCHGGGDGSDFFQFHGHVR